VGINWIGLAHDRDKWRALVNAAKNFGFYKMLGNYQVSTQLVACRLVLNSIQLVYDIERNPCAYLVSIMLSLLTVVVDNRLCLK
jgi:hypothetical protein